MPPRRGAPTPIGPAMSPSSATSSDNRAGWATPGRRKYHQSSCEPQRLRRPLWRPRGEFRLRTTGRTEVGVSRCIGHPVLERFRRRPRHGSARVSRPRREIEVHRGRDWLRECLRERAGSSFFFRNRGNDLPPDASRSLTCFWPVAPSWNRRRKQQRPRSIIGLRKPRGHDAAGIGRQSQKAAGAEAPRSCNGPGDSQGKSDLSLRQVEGC